MLKKLWYTVLLLFISNTVFAQVVVKTYGQHVGGAIVYTQEVTNTGTRGIVGFEIAHNTDYSDSSMPRTRGKGELTVYPVGMLDAEGMLIDPDVPPASFSGPTGWSAHLSSYHGDGGSYLIWRKATHPIPLIQPGQTATFRITVPTPDMGYLTGHYSARFVPTRETKIWGFYGVMEKLDIAPPSLSVSLDPIVIWPPNQKYIPITATITTTDNYDPQPAIKLESITANEPLEQGDIQEAQLGTDDRQFRLKAAREGNNKTGRIYTVTYSATDGTGNKAMATATVTVPQDKAK